MQYNDKIKLAKMLEPSYKQMMIPLYKELANYDSIEVRLEVIRWITNHNNSKILDLINKRKHRKLQFKKLKSELESQKLKQELEDYLKI